MGEQHPLRQAAQSARVGRSGAKLGALHLLAAGLALCGLVVLQQHRTNVLESDVSSRVVDGVPVFDWSDTHNVNMFEVACAQGNDMACKELAGNQEALNNLNLQAHAQARWDSMVPTAPSDMNKWGDELVPLDDTYEIGELQGQDLGNTLVPEDDVAFKHDKDDLTDEKIEKIMRRSGGSYPRGPHLKVFNGQQLRSNPVANSLQRQGLRLMVPGGLVQQQGIQSLVVDLCGPDSPYCGPTRPDDVYKADVVLTEPDEYGGWLNTNSNECCPCLGKGSRRIGYDQFEHNGYYNPYTMNLCRPCGAC
jgi:hypothetical protein